MKTLRVIKIADRPIDITLPDDAKVRDDGKGLIEVKVRSTTVAYVQTLSGLIGYDPDAIRVDEAPPAPVQIGQPVVLTAVDPTVPGVVNATPPASPPSAGSTDAGSGRSWLDRIGGIPVAPPPRPETD